jgi:cytochrome b5
MNEIYSLREVAQHDNNRDCWIIINSNIYDVTEFLNDHPAGQDVTLNYAGGDATESFLEIGHSRSAIELLEKFKIGKICQS